MDDNTLAAQYAETEDLMDLCNNEAWLRESAQIEDECSGQVEAGLGMQDYQQTANALTSDQMQQARQQMRIQSILFTELHYWMNEWELGAGFEKTYTIARRLVRAHLANPTPVQQVFLDALLAEGTQAKDNDQSLRQQVVAMLSEMFTPDDWQAMASAASQTISARVLSVGQMNTGTAIA